MTEIKPCPHCGSEGEIIERNNPMSKWRWSVDCASTTCGASGPVEATPAEAIAAWNTRTPDPSLIAGLREAREALAGITPTQHIGEDEQHRAFYSAARAALAKLDTLLSEGGR